MVVLQSCGLVQLREADVQAVHLARDPLPGAARCSVSQFAEADSHC